LKDEKKIYGAPDEDEFILDIGLNRAIELIGRDNEENVVFTEKNSGLLVILKNGRFGEYTEFNGFNKATKLKPEDKDPNPKVSYYEPNQIDYGTDSGRRYVLQSLRIEGFRKDMNLWQPVGIKIRKPGKAFKFVKYLKLGETEVETVNNWYKLSKEEKLVLIYEAFNMKPEEFIWLEDSTLI
jgi:hypothetical protein